MGSRLRQRAGSSREISFAACVHRQGIDLDVIEAKFSRQDLCQHDDRGLAHTIDAHIGVAADTYNRGDSDEFCRPLP